MMNDEVKMNKPASAAAIQTKLVMIKKEGAVRMFAHNILILCQRNIQLFQHIVCRKTSNEAPPGTAGCFYLKLNVLLHEI